MDRSESHRIEGVLATARAILAVTALVAIYIDPSEPSRYHAVAYFLFVAYVVYSIGILLFLRLTQRDERLQVPLHIGDIAWTAVLTVFTQGPNSPFFIFFTFVLVASAYRWEFRETVGT